MSQFPPARILVVDDHPDNLDLLEGVLQRQGYDVYRAASGREVFNTVSIILPNLILLDIMMPGMDGYTVCERLKANPETCNIPILFISALDDARDKVRGFQVGGMDYITKPFQIKEVLARVAHHLMVRRLQQDFSVQNAKLQAEIEARTQVELELRQKSDRLEQALQHINRAQVQLIQAEKMSSLGQLVAGITHEINNPINFVQGNLIHTTNYTQELLNLLSGYQSAFPDLPPELQAQLDSIDLDFMQEDLPKLIASMEVGTARILSIVQSLNVFSRLDQSSLQFFDLHEGLESSIVLLQHRFSRNVWRSKIIVERQYELMFPVECHAGQINQVFMDLLNNAIDAIDESWMRKTSNSPMLDPNIVLLSPKVRIVTRAIDDDWVQIQISDTGLGIDDAIRSRIFDPFFTTKPIGQGTGLGLSTSYQIIQAQHGGRIYQREISGETVFSIEIPRRQG
ncbi:MAG: response regulator [Cyanobacteria bacterium]|nr:response regulator [Cyanobacteriota bacterium]